MVVLRLVQGILSFSTNSFALLELLLLLVLLGSLVLKLEREGDELVWEREIM